MPRDLAVLFVCEHGAAKSVLAAELLGERVAALGLPVTIRSAGVAPGARVSDRLFELFPERAWKLASESPSLVSVVDVEDASIVVTFNLGAEALPGSPRRRLLWDDVPPVSEDPVAAAAAIERHLEELVDALRA
jgi:protein-tyrosine-phosphatase